MGRNRVTAMCTLCAVLAIAPARLAAAADGAQFAFSVKKGHLFGASSGTLRVTSTGIEYDTRDKADGRHWAYRDIRQIQISSPKRITLWTYEDQGWLKFGADRHLDFEVRDGSLSPELIDFILAHTDRPVVTAVLPPPSKSPLFSLLVKHERHRRGSNGVLMMYDDALVYGTEQASETRYWRFMDVFAVLPLDRDRLQVLVYEGGAGELRPFTFQLKSAMSDEFRRVLWARINPPAPFVVPASAERRVATDPERAR